MVNDTVSGESYAHQVETSNMQDQISDLKRLILELGSTLHQRNQNVPEVPVADLLTPGTSGVETRTTKGKGKGKTTDAPLPPPRAQSLIEKVKANFTRSSPTEAEENADPSYQPCGDDDVESQASGQSQASRRSQASGASSQGGKPDPTSLAAHAGGQSVRYVTSIQLDINR